MSPQFFSKQNFHSLECIALNDNSFNEICICENCLCHYCQYKNNKTYRKKYLVEYFSKGIFEN